MTLRVGILGFGGAGRAHYTLFGLERRCEVVRIFDPKEAGRQRAAKKAKGVEVCDTLDGFFEGLDAVSICTPDATHAEYICAALEHDVHVLCEKPLTNSVEGIQAIADAAAKSRAVVGVLHQMRTVPLFEEIKRSVDAGEVGNVAYLEGYYVHDLSERAFKFDDWREHSDATAMVYAGCHFVDMVRWLVGEEPDEVYTMAGHVAFPRYPESDLNVALFRFPSGAVAKVTVSIGTAGPQDHTVRVYGTDASIDNALLFGRDGEWKRTLHRPKLVHRELLDPRASRKPRSLWRQLGENTVPWLLARSFDALRRLAPHPNTQYGARHYPVRLYEHKLACYEAVRNFVAAIHGEEEIHCGVEESSRTVLACLAAVESFRTNQPTKIERLDAVL